MNQNLRLIIQLFKKPYISGKNNLRCENQQFLKNTRKPSLSPLEIWF